MAVDQLREPLSVGALAGAVWHNEPVWWTQGDAGDVSLSVEGGTNFWQGTRHGRREDSGHFLGVPVSPGFELTAVVSDESQARYDQAGLMVRATDRCWAKCAVEYHAEGRGWLSVVVTNGGWSDWSMTEVAVRARRFRVRCDGDDIGVGVESLGGDFVNIRVAHLRPLADKLVAGVFACAPRGTGFQARFSDIALRYFQGDVLE